MDAIAIVPVRAGSRGLPGKNLRAFCGMPLYLRAVEQGIRALGKVLVSTDIAEICQDMLPVGGIVCRRPAELALDSTPMEEVIRHVIDCQRLQGQAILLLQATSPLRLDNDIRKAISKFSGGQYSMVLSVARRDSGVQKYGTLSRDEFKSFGDPKLCFRNRQALPAVYGPNGAIYIFDANSFISEGGFPTKKIGAIEMPRERSLDIDNEDDFMAAERIFLQRHRSIKGKA